MTWIARLWQDVKDGLHLLFGDALQFMDEVGLALEETVLKEL